MTHQSSSPERPSELPTLRPPRPRRRAVQVERIEPIAAVFSKPVAESWTLADPARDADGFELEPRSGIKQRTQPPVGPRKFVPPIPREEPDE